VSTRPRVLFVQGGWKGHDPLRGAERFAGLLAGRGFEPEIADSLAAYEDVDHLRTFALIVPTWTMGRITIRQQRGLMRAVAEGVGVAGWHGTMGDSFRMATSYQFLVGGQFVDHPDEIHRFRVHVPQEPDDPITRGIPDFELESEQYYMHVDPSNRVLATTTFATRDPEWADGVVMPCAWRRRWGRGRVFYSSLGHFVSDFDVEELRELQLRGMTWAAEGPEPMAIDDLPEFPR
jgi:uncharacterized protein